MADEFDFFSNDSNNWNYNPFINTPNADPYNNKRVFCISSNNNVRGEGSAQGLRRLASFKNIGGLSSCKLHNAFMTVSN